MQIHATTMPPTKDFIVDGQAPQEVWMPETNHQAVELVKSALDHSVAIIPLGSGTKRHIGLPPSRYDVALSTRKLKGIEEHSPEDLTVTVRAGTSVLELQQLLASYRQFLPIDPPFPDLATIGGVIATAMAGPCRCLYGGIREHLLGIRVVQPVGNLTRFGGKVVKNVAGYDLTKLYVGSFGSLGLITEATFKVRPMPESQATVVTYTDDPQIIEQFLNSLVNRRITPAFVELLNKFSFYRLSEVTSLTPQSPSPYLLLVGFDGFREEIDWWLKEVRNLASETKLILVETLVGEVENCLRMQQRNLHAGQGMKLILKVILPSSQVCTFVQKICTVLSDENWGLISHALNGIVRVLFDEIREPVKLVHDLLSFAVQLGGNLMIEQAPTDWKSSLPIWGKLDPSWKLMKKLKSELDPKNIFSPGRMGLST